MKKIIFFTAGFVPTDAEIEAAMKVGANHFRNAALADRDKIEPCDAVAGAVPEAYRRANIEILQPQPARKAAKEAQ